MTFAAELLAGAGEWGHHGGWWPIFPILWFLFIGFVVFTIFRRRRFGGPWHHTHSAEGVLGERYVKGEIDEDEYRKRLGVLKQERKS